MNIYLKKIKIIYGLMLFMIMIMISGCISSYDKDSLKEEDFIEAAKVYVDANLKYDYSNIELLGYPWQKDGKKLEKDETFKLENFYRNDASFIDTKSLDRYLTDEQIENIVKKHFLVQKNAKYNISSEEVDKNMRLMKIQIEIIDAEKMYVRLLSIIADKLDKEGETNIYSDYVRKNNKGNYPKISSLVSLGERDEPEFISRKELGKKISKTKISKIIEESLLEVYDNPDLKTITTEILLGGGDSKIYFVQKYEKFLEGDFPYIFWNRYYQYLFPGFCKSSNYNIPEDIETPILKK